MQKVDLSYMLHPISLYAFRRFWIPSLKSGDSFLQKKFAQTPPLKAFPSCSFCVSKTFYKGFIINDFSDLSSHEDDFFHSSSVNVGKFFAQVLEYF